MFPGLQSKVSFGIDAKDKAHFLSFDIPKESAWFKHLVDERMRLARD